MYFEIGDHNALKDALNQICGQLERDEISPDAVFAVRLVGNELLSNVLQHGGGRAYFTVSRAGEEIRLSVRADREFRPPRTSVCSAVDEECGRGLFLVDAYCVSRRYSEEDGICVVIRGDRFQEEK